MHNNDGLSMPTEAGEPVRCLKSGVTVRLRGIRDDPDDPQYGIPRCHVCQLELKSPAAPCPECGTQPGS